jgi:hypothetical protein
LEFDQKLQELKIDKSLECLPERLGRYDRLGGYLGIADLIERGSRSRERTPAQAGSISKLAYTVEFIVKKNASLTPKFNLIPIGKEKVYTGSAKWLGSRSDTQKLVLTFTPSPEKEEACAVVADVPEPWMAPRKCPAAFYQVNVRPACHILPTDALCKEREDCALPRDSQSCLPACHVLIAQKQCEARKQDCEWVPTTKSCVMTKAEQSRLEADKSMAEQRKARGMREIRPRRLVVPSPAAPSGLSAAERDALDRASSRTDLQSIDTQLRRQGIVP